jgi:hypothetical protein
MLQAIVAPAPVLVVASSCTVTTLTPSALIDVVTGISRFVVVDDAFMDRGRLVPLGGKLGMDRALSFLSGGLRRLLRGKPASPLGRTLGLLHGGGLEESSGFDGLGMLRRSMATTTTFWLARSKTGGSPA